LEEALQYTQLITNIIIILLFIGLLIAVFKLISGIKDISARIEKISSGIMDIKPKVEKTIEKVNGLTDNVNTLVGKINDNVHVLSTVVEKIKDTADDIIEFEQKIQKKIEPPILDTLTTISAVTVGIKTFFEKLKENKRNKFLNFQEPIPEFVDEPIEDINKELEEVNEKLTNMQK